MNDLAYCSVDTGKGDAVPSWLRLFLRLHRVLLIAALAGNRLAFAAGGVSFAPRFVSQRANLNGLAYGGGRYVAVGWGGAVVTSGDSQCWTITNSGTGQELRAVVWGGGVWVAVGDGGALALSADGVTWNVRAAPYPEWRWEFRWDLAWMGTRFVAVGESGMTYTSSDGKSWTASTSASSHNLLGVAWNGSLAVAVGRLGAILTSSDGLEWTERVSGTRGDLKSVVWGGSQFVAVGSQPAGYTGPAGLIVTSPDGVTWTQAPTELFGDPKSATWTGNKFLIVTSDGVVFGSSDGLTWTGRAYVGVPLTDVVAGASEIVAVGGNGATLRSTDGISWESVWDFDLYVPAAANLPGLNGSSWHTDLSVHNPGNTVASYTVALLVRDSSNYAPDALSFSIPPGASVLHQDVLASVFGFSGAATLRVTPSCGQVLVGARTYDDAPNGSYGQYVAAVVQYDSIGPVGTARMIQLSQSADRARGFRTNLGIVNATVWDTAVEVELYRADGVLLGKREYSLGGYESIQRNEIFREVTSENVDDGYALVRATSDWGQFFAYATVIDNRSNDPVFVIAR